jgi:threonine dehydratase
LNDLLFTLLPAVYDIGMHHEPTITTIQTAHARIEPYVHHTPVMTCATLDRLTGAKLFFKCENFQKAGAFKSRGAVNAVFSLSKEEAARGVATHSSGNHAAALARAAQLRGIPAYIVMPQDSNRLKIAAVEGYGSEITFCAPTLAARESAAAQVLERTGATMIHPYDNLQVIAGQGTAALELLAEVSDLDAIVVPVGGGGLLSGTLITAKTLQPKLKVMGAEPALADDAYRGWQAGRRMPPCPPVSIADGLRTSLGEITAPIIFDLVDDILLASEEGILHATRLLLERMKIVVEPSAAVPLAALLEQKTPLAAQRIGIVLSGGNVDLEAIVRH